jgi:hypothetical protein
MEASERQSQERPDAGEEGLAEGAVRAIDDRLVIERLEIADERAARVVRERAEGGQPPARTVTDAVEIGARVLDREDLAGEIDYVRAEFERAAGELSRGFGDQARQLAEGIQNELQRIFDGEGGLLSQALDGHADEIAEQIANHFGEDRSTAVQHQIKESVSKLVEERLQMLVRHFASDDAANPFADVKRGITQAVADSAKRQEQGVRTMGEAVQRVEKEMVRLSEQTEAKRQLAEAEERGTAKGRSFEERVFAALERMAEGRGDAARAVGDERSEGGTKKGDAVVEIDAASGPSAGRIAFEAKTEKLSKKRAWDELNDAMAERDAGFAVLVVAGEGRVPAGREPLHEYEGNKLIVAVDSEEPDGLALEVAYRYARCRVLMARDRSLTVDAAGVRDAAEEAASALKETQKIRLALTGVESQAEKAKTGLDQMEQGVRRHLDRIEQLVSEAD